MQFELGDNGLRTNNKLVEVVFVLRMLPVPDAYRLVSMSGPT
jgi:hypothetical protein